MAINNLRSLRAQRTLYRQNRQTLLGQINLFEFFHAERTRLKYPRRGAHSHKFSTNAIIISILFPSTLAHFLHYSFSVWCVEARAKYCACYLRSDVGCAHSLAHTHTYPVVPQYSYSRFYYRFTALAGKPNFMNIGIFMVNSDEGRS